MAVNPLPNFLQREKENVRDHDWGKMISLANDASAPKTVVFLRVSQTKDLNILFSAMSANGRKSIRKISDDVADRLVETENVRCMYMGRFQNAHIPGALNNVSLCYMCGQPTRRYLCVVCSEANIPAHSSDSSGDEDDDIDENESFLSGSD